MRNYFNKRISSTLIFVIFNTMTTITISENINLEKHHFESVEEFQAYLLISRQEGELGEEHKAILDERLKEEEVNPDNKITLEELKKSIRRS